MLSISRSDELFAEAKRCSLYPFLFLVMKMRLFPPKITSSLRVKSYLYFFFDSFDVIIAVSFMSQTTGKKSTVFS